MIEMLSRILRTIAFVLVALISLGMALIFTISTLVAVIILFVAMRLRGQKFSVQEYWTTRQSKRKPIFGKGVGASQQVSDIDARDVR
jgi:hypothetical protein